MESNGRLTLSFDGGLSFPSTDDKVLSIVDANAPTITSRETADLDVDGFIDAAFVTFSKNVDDATVTAGDFTFTGFVTAAGWTTGGLANDGALFIHFTDGCGNDRNNTLRRKLHLQRRGKPRRCRLHIRADHPRHPFGAARAGESARPEQHPQPRAGATDVRWHGENRNGKTVIPGVYYIVVKIGGDRYVKKALVVK